jgi:ABC-type phosphate/phosphonate transport system permease subunit
MAGTVTGYLGRHTDTEWKDTIVIIITIIITIILVQLWSRAQLWGKGCE